MAAWLRGQDAIQVTMGAAAVAEPPTVLEVRGLGSCIALGLCDPHVQVAGLAHTVIPHPRGRPLPGPAWASSEAAGHLVRLMERRGAARRRMEAYVAGGASMFPGLLKEFNVGEANARAVLEALDRLRIPIRACQIGGSVSRNVRLDPSDGAFLLDQHEEPYPTPAPHGALGADSEREIANIVLHHALDPLASLMEQPVTVRDAGAYELSSHELITFFGGPQARLMWASVTLDWEGDGEVLGLLLPEPHALGLLETVREVSGVPANDWDLFTEVANLMANHAVTALGRIFHARIVPGVPKPAGGGAQLALREVFGDLPSTTPVLTLHGRAYAPGGFRGADVALVLSRLKS